MSPGADSCASRSRPSPVLLLLGLLLLPAVVARVIPAPGEGDGDLHCICVKTTSEVHAKHIMSLEVIRAGLHCPISQLIATLKNGRKICLDPQVPTYKKIVRKLIESKPLAV